MIRVLVADDHAIVRQGLKLILSEEFDSLVLGEACSGRELLQLVDRDDWDIVVLDITLSDRNGLDILKDLKLQRPKLPVLILSMHSEDQFAVRSLKAGASGYMTKENVPEELVKAIKKVLGGGRYVSATLAEKLAFELDAQVRPPHEALSDREYQVLRMIASGRTVSEIAEELALSVKTISTYRARVLEKLRMKTNAELTHYAIRNSLV
ncbi:MAG: response regulator transcription factor [Syntrophobacteraceae bacterium]|jgi:DNA-binding NarL/FixJ family response regulator|nr:response regulator transcription factor [Syntrophobacteraceae bacterium]